jgi:uncharacterized protein
MIDTRHVSLDLMEFVEQSILPKYNAFDKAHNLTHVNRVIKNSLALAEKTGADINMVYVIAAYHDLGLEGPRAVHHLRGGKIVVADRRLRRWFSEEKIKIIKEAVEDHRASASHTPRSIYGKIVAEADRDLDPMTVFTRAVEYGIDHYPEKSRDEQWQRFLQHVTEKYSNSGYMKLWIPNSPNEAKLKEIRETISNAAQLRQVFDDIYNRIKV